MADDWTDWLAPADGDVADSLLAGFSAIVFAVLIGHTIVSLAETTAFGYLELVLYTVSGFVIAPFVLCLCLIVIAVVGKCAFLLGRMLQTVVDNTKAWL